MKTRLLVSCLLIAVLVTQAAVAQLPYSTQSEYEMAARELRSAPARQYNFSKAVMSDVMRLMAEDAGISFFGLPDEGPGSDRMVTFTINASPFTALETLAKANGVSLIYENGIWYLRPANDKELIGRIYEINYNAQELVRKNTQGGGQESSTSSGTGSGIGAGINLQGAPDFFVTEPSRLLEDIKGILDIPTTGANANIAPTASVDTVSQFSLAGLPNQPALVTTSGSPSDGDGSAPDAKVIWNSDSNTLYVVATRQQHQWIEAYLASADREQTMIAVEVKFLETSRDPRLDLGIDWTGVLGPDGNGLGARLTDNTGPIDLGNLSTYRLPTAVLSYDDLNVKLGALYSDSRTKTVSYPRMVTLDNREVSFRSVINQPVLSSTASASLGAGATQTSAIEYLPIGTVINVLPKKMNNGRILLNVSVTVSDIVGTEVINGNPFPIASSRVYSAPLTVRSGYTVAISGLDSANTSHVEEGVPILGQLPVLGGAFRFKRKNQNRQHLMMLITPVIMNNGCGIQKRPMSKDPWRRCDDPSVTDCPSKCAPQPHVPEATAYPAKSTLTSFDGQDRRSESRKSSFRFGQKNAAVNESAYAGHHTPAPSAPVAETVKTETPSVVATPVRVPALESPAPRQAAEIPPSPPATQRVEQPENSEIARINQSVERLRSELETMSGSEQLTTENRKKLNQVVEESKVLLSQIEQMRGEDSATMSGELGDTWWNVIKLKTDAVKMGRE